MPAQRDSPDPAASVELGRTLAEKGNFDAAIQRFREACEASIGANLPVAKLALQGWSKALYARKDYERAAEKLKEALELDPHDAGSYRILNMLAQALVEANRFEEAERLWSAAIAIGAQTNALARWTAIAAWAEALQKRKDYQRAAEKLKEQLQLDPNDEISYDTFNPLAQALIEANQFEEAERLWSEAVAIGAQTNAPARRIALRRWSEALREQKNYEGAAEKLKEALKLNPNDEYSYYAFYDLAQVLGRVNRFDEADRAWSEAIAIGAEMDAPERRLALGNWGEALRERKNYEGAAEKLKEAHRIDPTDERSYKALNILARALVEANRFDEAEQLWSDAVAIGAQENTPVRRIAMIGWGAALRERKEYERAAAILKEALKLDPEDEISYETFNPLAQALIEANRFEEAERYWSEAIAIGAQTDAPERRLALGNWSDALRQRKDYEGAAEKLKEAHRINPADERSYHAFNRLARSLIEANRLGEAERLWSEAVAIGAQENTPVRRIAMIGWEKALQEHKQYERAAEILKEALKLGPEDEDSYRALNTLARSLIEADRLGEAEQLWSEAVAIGVQEDTPVRRIAMIGWGTALQERKEYGRAGEMLKEALKLGPENEDCYEVLNTLARALIGANQFKEAERHWSEAITIGAKADASARRIALLGWGDGLVDVRRFKEARDRYLDAIEIDTNTETFDRFSRIAHGFAQAGRFDEVDETLKKALEKVATISPEDRAIALDLWGWTMKSLQLQEQAASSYREALNLAPDNAYIHHNFGNLLVDQGLFEQAIAQFSKSVAILEGQEDQEQKDTGKSVKGALSDWSFALLAQDRFDEAIEKAECAVAADPDDFWQYYNHSIVLRDSGRLIEALAASDTAIAKNNGARDAADNEESRRDYDHPRLYHNRAYLLFQLGRYAEGWTEWHFARDRYEYWIDERADETEPDVESNAERAQVAIDFAGVLTGIFSEYEDAEKYYKIAIGLQNYNAAAWRGLTDAYQKWADADESPADLPFRLSRALQQAIMLTKKQLGKGNDFSGFIALADLHIDNRDWLTAEDCLTAARELVRDSRIKRGEVDARRGLLHLRAERYAEAVESLCKTVNVWPGNLEQRTNLGKAMLRAKRFGDAQREFTKVLKSASGHIDALTGAAQVCIELAEEGDTEQYREAERHLSDALRHGRDTETGSYRLTGSQLDNVHYLRGYSRIKRWEAEGKVAMPVTVFGALQDFRRCSKKHADAGAATTKIRRHLNDRVRRSLAWVGGFVIFCAAAAVFTLVQLDFFFGGHPFRQLADQTPHNMEPATYISLTFGGLLFMIAGLYLPNMQRLKVPGIELTKAATEQIAKPSSLGLTLPKEM